ncbi:WXG100 family type VII secretion target, partial [Glycomyces tenuis]
MGDNPLVADVEDSHHFWKGAGIGEDIADVVAAIKSESWVDASLAGLSTAMSAVGFLDPLGAIVSTGVSWLIELIEPLRELLDDLTGDADVLTAHAQTWTNMANELMAVKDELSGFIDADITGWKDDAADAYKANMGNNVEGTGGLAQLCAAMSAATTGAGTLVTLTRELVRDIIAQLVATLLIRL